MTKANKNVAQEMYRLAEQANDSRRKDMEAKRAMYEEKAAKLVDLVIDDVLYLIKTAAGNGRYNLRVCYGSARNAERNVDPVFFAKWGEETVATIMGDPELRMAIRRVMEARLKTYGFFCDQGNSISDDFMPDKPVFLRINWDLPE